MGIERACGDESLVEQLSDGTPGRTELFGLSKGGLEQRGEMDEIVMRT